MKHITKKDFVCPHCGQTITEDLLTELKETILFEFRSRIGSVKTAKKSTSCKKNIAAVNAAYDTEKRKAAWQKRKARKENTAI